jgi:predicted transcriptional regulator
MASPNFMGATMASPSPNVLPLFSPPRKMSYRAAVAKIVRELKAKHALSNVKLADLLDCSDETISNAENEHTDLNAVTLLRVGYQFGEESIAPALDLMRRRQVEPETLTDRFDALQSQLALVRRETGA